MTTAEICTIVCECLQEIGIVPGQARDEVGGCEEDNPADLALTDEAIIALFACMHQKFRARGCSVILGKTMWTSAETVRQFCEGAFDNHWCE
jgi:hypothetical protein